MKKKYSIVLFCNNKRVKVMHSSMKRTTIYEYWRELRTQKQPRFLQKIQQNSRTEEAVYELALIFPNNRWANATYVKDSLGRNREAIIEDSKFRIKEIIPYWKEELVYDFNKKKRIRYHEMMEQLVPIKEIAQIFTLNNKLFVQVEDDIKFFGNRNLKDTDRLFELVKEDIIKKGKGNFIFVKDITTYQRKQLYNLLESKGFKRQELFRHYSY